jgi:glycosyltransferase involved in cell wall biosynthesis
VEQWGLTVNEAMASGCPVIATDQAGATATLLTDGVSGIVTTPDAAALTTALSRLMAADRTAMAEAAGKVIAGWGPERFAAGMLQAAAGAVVPGARSRPLEAALLRRLAAQSAS